MTLNLARYIRPCVRPSVPIKLKKALKVGNPAIFNSYLLRHLQWELATDHWFLN